MIEKIKDPVSCLTHLFGAVAAAVCLVALLVRAAPLGGRYTLSFAVFGVSLVLLYSASAAYHMFRLSEDGLRLLRRIDHTMIFYLIAGTYTPVCLIPLWGAWGWSILGTVWGLALAGTFMKIFWLTAPRMVSTLIYVIMGWIVLAALYPLFKAITGTAFALLLAGGMCYTAGAVIYAVKRPVLNIPGFGFHEIFHVFVLAGSAFHTAFMFLLPA
jgi:hemolysin III